MKDLIRTYLQAQGYRVEEAFRGLKAVMPQSELGGSDSVVFVWTADDQFGRSSGPTMALISQMQEALKQDSEVGTNRTQFYIRDDERIPQDLRDRMARLRIAVREPIQFFDAAFRFEASSSSTAAEETVRRSPSRMLRDAGEATALHRVKQPYSVDGTASSADILETLAHELSRRDAGAVPLHIVVGPAGAGKSVMFETLFSRLYKDFQDSKERRRDARRPLALTPDHARSTERERVTFDALFENYLSSDFSRPVPRSLFRWRLENGYSTWMIDGLDEVISKDEDFFEELIHILSDSVNTDGSRPSILICLRESMFSTNDLLAAFLDSIRDSVEYRVYRMEKWDRETVADFVQLQNPPTEVRNLFFELLEKDSLGRLAELPFYCSQLLESLTETDSRARIEAAATSDADHVEDVVLEAFVKDFIARDRRKGFIHEETPDGILLDVMQECAAVNYRSGYLGIPMETYSGYFDLLVPAGLDDEQKRLSEDALKRLAFFSPSRTEAATGSAQPTPLRAAGGNIRFMSDVLAEYLFACELQRVWNGLDRGQTAAPIDRLAEALNGPVLPSGSLAFSRVRSRFSEQDANRLVVAALDLKGADGNGAFRNIMQLALEVAKDGGRDLLQDFAGDLTAKDFRGLTFQSLDLSDVSLADCDLTNVKFMDCTLTGTNLQAVIQDTHFIGSPKEKVAEADFGDLSRFVSARIGEQEYEDLASFREMLLTASEENARAIRETCPTFEELWDLVGRYRNRDGSAKRDQHLGRTIRSKGRRNMLDRKPLIDKLLKAGYLVHVPDRDLYRLSARRAREFADFARSRNDLGPLEEILDAVCEPDCPHVFE